MVKKTLAMVLALASGASPLHAQTLDGGLSMGGPSPVAMGSFVGARIRIPLGGTNADERSVRLGLTVAPMQRSDGNGLKSPVWRIGEGFEFGITSEAPTPHLSLAGFRLDSPRYAPGRRPAKKDRNHLSGGETTIAVVVGVVLVGGGLLFALNESGDPDNCVGGECNNN
jgi:hypothetical protein